MIMLYNKSTQSCEQTSDRRNVSSFNYRRISCFQGNIVRRLRRLSAESSHCNFTGGKTGSVFVGSLNPEIVFGERFKI